MGCDEVSVVEAAKRSQVTITADNLIAPEETSHLIRELTEFPLKIAAAYGTGDEYTSSVNYANEDRIEKIHTQSLIQPGMPTDSLERIVCNSEREFTEGMIIMHDNHAYKLNYHINHSRELKYLTRYWEPVGEVLHELVAKEEGKTEIDSQNPSIPFSSFKLENKQLSEKLDKTIELLPKDSYLANEVEDIKSQLLIGAFLNVGTGARRIVELMCKDLYDWKLNQPNASDADAFKSIEELIDTPAVGNSMGQKWKFDCHQIRKIGGRYGHLPQYRRAPEAWKKKIADPPDRIYIEMVTSKLLPIISKWHSKVPPKFWKRAKKRLWFLGEAI